MTDEAMFNPPPGERRSPARSSHDPATVVPLPTALTPEQRRQQVMWRRHAAALSTFLEGPTRDNETRARDTGNKWIKAFLGEGPDAEQAHRFLDKRLLDVRYRLLVKRLCALGERPVGELLLEVIGVDERLRDDVFALLERYTRLTPAEVCGAPARGHAGDSRV